MERMIRLPIRVIQQERKSILHSRILTPIWQTLCTWWIAAESRTPLSEILLRVGQNAKTIPGFSQGILLYIYLFIVYKHPRSGGGLFFNPPAFKVLEGKKFVFI